MRIDDSSLIKALQSIQPRKVNRVAGVEGAEATDAVELTSRAADVSAAMAALNGAPEIREETVNELRSQIEQGTFSVSEDALADKLFAQAKWNKGR